MSSLKCHCGYYHYTIHHWSKIHGESEKIIDPYVRVALVGNEVWDESKYNPTEPYPVITYQQVCQFCGSLSSRGHQTACFYLKVWK